MPDTNSNIGEFVNSGVIVPGADDIERTTELLERLPEETGDIEYLLGDENFEAECPDFRSRFKFICYFAAGGMGQVGKARDLTFDRVVAVKSLKEKYRNNPSAIKAFLEECRLNAQLDHPSIVPVYAMGKNQSGSWEVMMKMINGVSLAAFIKTTREAYAAKKATSREEQHAMFSRLEYFLKICEVIDYCHSRKIIHGDLKPENIMMGQYGEVYVMDWGCARYDGAVPERLTGTPNYLPPEFIKNRKVSVQLDIYSLGMLLFELVTLQRSRGDNSGSKHSGTGATTRQNIHQPEQWHFQDNIPVKPAMKAIINKATAIDPGDRYRSVTELANDVRHFIFNEEVSAYPDNWFRGSMRTIFANPVKSLLVVGFCFALLAGLLAYSYHESSMLKQKNTIAMMQRAEFQRYTNELASAVEKNFFTTQALLMLYADNMVEQIRNLSKQKVSFYSNEQYSKPETSPPDIQKSTLYEHPVTVRNIVTYPAGGKSIKPYLNFEEQEFIHICRKTVSTDFDTQDVTTAIFGRILTSYSMLNRLFVFDQNGTGYSFPGTYDQPGTPQYTERWLSADNQTRDRQIKWGFPYAEKSGVYRIIVRFPMFNRNEEYTGMAGFELRCEQVLEPLAKAYVDDPTHGLYFVDTRGGIPIRLVGKGLIMPDKNDQYEDGIRGAEILRLAERLKGNGFHQFEVIIGGKNCLVSGAKIGIINGILISLTDCEDLDKHYHE